MSAVRWLTCAAADVPEHDAWLSPPELDVQSDLRFAPRRTSWRLGRWAAKQALLHALGEIAPARLSVLAAEDGAPEPYLDGRPLARVLSLSHRESFAVAALADAPVGVDLEAVEPRSDTFLETYLTEAERALVRAAEDHALAANLVWSAKESALKRLRTGLRRDTRSVQVDLRFDAAATDDWAPLSVRDLESHASWPGWWRRLVEQPTLVLTVVGEAAEAPPRRW